MNLGLELTPGQRVEVKFDAPTRYARMYGTIESVVPEIGTRMVKLDKVETVIPFAESDLAALISGRPHYNPSERCESGMRPGCTCDTCF